MTIDGKFPMVAKTLAGFEQILSDELKAIGAEDIQIIHRAVSFSGDKELMYKANLWLRTALRVLVPIKLTTAKDSDELYKRGKEIDWSTYITTKDTFAIDSTTSGEEHHHSLFASQRLKDAIADQFNEKFNERPSVELDKPTLRINLYIHNTDVTISLDSSGDSLHKRGYRLEANLAPLNEVLAAGMILLTGWDGKSNFGDIMCGSGTILIEAAWIAMNRAPGLLRDYCGFHTWKDFDEELWGRLRTEAEEKIHEPKGKFFGSDLSSSSIAIAENNMERAGVSEYFELERKDFRNAHPPEGGGVLVVNPPYDERIEVEDIGLFYEQLGDALKKNFKGFHAWILTGNPEGMKKVGLKTSRKIPLFNGPIECRFLKYELYDGSRKRVKSEEIN